MTEVKILGFYRREKDETEYVHYLSDGKEHLTNGVCDWTQEVSKKVSALHKVDKINLQTMKVRMKNYYPHEHITDIL